MEDETPAPTDTHAFYIVAHASIYETIRAELDEAFEHPKGGTDTCIPPVEDAPLADGLPMVAVKNHILAWPEVGPRLFDLVNQGHVSEITRAQWDAYQPQSSP